MSAPPLIAALDHVVIAVRDLARGAAAYEALLGREAISCELKDGIETALVVVDNISVELMAPVGENESAERLRKAMEESGEGLKSLVFATSDIARMHRRAERVGLQPEPIKTRENRQDAGGPGWKSFRVNTERSHGVRLFFLAREAPLPRTPAQAGCVTGLDHIVIRTPDPERAAALYGARLGLDMRLDREIAGRRLMFFRCGDAVIEIAHDESMTEAHDLLWGLSWRVANADAAQARLAAAGFDVSQVRAGLKPGTRVFTVREGACGVATLMIEPGPKHD